MFDGISFDGRWLGRWLAVAALCRFAGLNSSASVPDFDVQRWTNEAGLPQNRVDCLWQTRNGYLLLGTRAGVLRFDGLDFTPVAVGAMSVWLRESVCTALLEDREGRLWVGTKRGLGCWAGGVFRRFTEQQGLPTDNIHCLADSRNGGLWVGTSGGLALWDGERFRTYPPPLAAALFVRAVVEDPHGTVWVGSSAGLHRLDPDTASFEEIWAGPLKTSGDPDHGAESLVLDREGRVWFGTRSGVGWVDSLRGSLKAPPHPPGTSAGDRPGLLLPSTQGLWTFGPGGVALNRSGQWTVPPITDELEGVIIRCALEDREGNLWLGTAHDGLWRLRPTTVRSPDLAANLEHVPAWSICPAQEGGVWVATDRGLLRLRNDHSERFPLPPGGLETSLRCVLETRAGDLWVGTAEQGLLHFRRAGGEWVPVPKPPQPRLIRALLEDRSGTVWVGTKDGLLRFATRPTPLPTEGIRRSEPGAEEQWHFRPDGMRYCRGEETWSEREGRWRPDVGETMPGFTRAELRSRSEGDWVDQIPEGRLTDGEIHAVLEDRRGRLWIGTGEGGLNRLADGRFEAWGIKEGLGSQSVYALCEDEDGVLWIGTSRGLTRWQEGRFFHFQETHGLVDPLVNQIVDDGRGALWLGGHRGLTRVGREELNAVAEGRQPIVRGRVLGRADGMPASETNGEVQPAGARTPDGRLWFPTTHGLAVVDPVGVPDPPAPAPVLIETIRATDRLLTHPFTARDDGVTQGSLPEVVPGSEHDQKSAPLVLPAGSGRFVEFHYASVNLTAPEKTRYRYQLQGHDDRWIEANRQRAVSYANLRPGRYHFRVAAVDRHGAWSPEPAVVSFVLRPHWYQTSWFQLGAVGAAVALILELHRRQMAARVRREQRAAEMRLAQERTRISRDLHDDLGASLARAQLLLGRLRRESAAAREGSARLGEIEDSVRACWQTMREVIWTTHPDYDTLGELGTRLAVFAQEYLGPLGVRCRLDFPETWPALAVRAEVRHSLLLAVKEAIHNAVEHGQASEIHLGLRSEPGRLQVTVSDNGRGMAPRGPSDRLPGNDEPLPSRPPDSPGRGDGLVNLRRRLESLGGRVTVASHVGIGTTLHLEMPW